MTKKVETTNFNKILFERMQGMNRSWLESLREIRHTEVEFGNRLLTAKNTSEATTVCNEWMTKRLEIVTGEQRAFTTAWFALISDVLTSTSPLSVKTFPKDPE